MNPLTDYQMCDKPFNDNPLLVSHFLSVPFVQQPLRSMHNRADLKHATENFSAGPLEDKENRGGPATQLSKHSESRYFTRSVAQKVGTSTLVKGLTFSEEESIQS